MTTDRPSGSARRVAIVGGGISGIAAAYRLRKTHRVTLYEAEPRLGGHARTRMAGRNGDVPVDTGFIVFNRQNYPNVSAFFDELGVPVRESPMSFGVSARGGRLEYALTDLDALFARRRHVGDPRFLRMLWDITRFNARAGAAVRPDMTIGDLLDALGTGDWFRDYYLLPFSGAIWSTPCSGILDFPAEPLIRFFENHALMRFSGQHRWYTVAGGSIEYVRRAEAALIAAGVSLRLSTPVARITRDAGGATIFTAAEAPERFDEVILATHADLSRRLLADADAGEDRALAAIRFQPNHAVLHSDVSVMPRRRAVWSSWTYREPECGRGARIGLNYWMNALQGIAGTDPLFVTLNGARDIDPARIHDEVTFRHPVYDRAALEAQGRLSRINGRRATWFCGAWMRNGFHEDGFSSALDVVERLGASARPAVAAE